MNAIELRDALERIDRRNPLINPEGAEFMVGKFLDLAKLRQGRTVTWIDSPAILADKEIADGYFMGDVLRRLRSLSADNWFRIETQVLQELRTIQNLTPKQGDRTMQVQHERVQTLWGDICIAAIEYGAWYVAVTADEIFVLRRPAIHVDDQNRLHSENGPAIAWPHGPYSWWLSGFRVTEKIVTKPRTITVEEIHGERNVEVRRIMQERMGLDRYMKAAGGRKIAEEEPYGVLWQVSPPNDEPITLLEVTNRTAEPDGTHRHYFLRVPNNLRNPRTAAAWTFNVKSDDYKPAKET